MAYGVLWKVRIVSMRAGECDGSMELRHLRYFVAVADECHITRAAARLGIQQPPLSQQIKALEAELGFRLFDRIPQGVALTEGGASFLVDAREILASVERAAARALRVASGGEGQVILGLSTSVALHPFLPDLLRTFRHDFPGVQLDLQSGNAAELTEGVMRRTLDAAILRTPVASTEGMRYCRLIDEPMWVALPSNHRLARRGEQRRKTIALRALADESFILVRRPDAPGMYADLLSACRQAGFVPKIAAEVSQMLMNVTMVGAGLGVSVVPEAMRQFHVGSVAYLRLLGAPGLSAPVTFISRVDSRNGAVERLIAMARLRAQSSKAQGQSER
jgi:DNA-binding transcriptional LysR family regulator